MPRRRPRSLKELAGTLREDREAPASGGNLITRRPGPPRDLAPAALQPWRELAEAAIAARVLRPSALPVLRVAAEALAVYRRALAEALEGPLMTSGSRGQARTSPAAMAAATWWTRTVAALAQLGLTPRAAGLVEAEPPDAAEVEDVLSGLIRRGQGRLPLGEDGE